MSSQKTVIDTGRPSMRGLKRCKSCGTPNGQRAMICRNELCDLRMAMLEEFQPFDPVQLVVVQKDTTMYSLRSKLRCTQPRNFVQITEVTLSVDDSTSIVSRNEICYIDNCKYDAADATEISCKHIKACTLDGAKTKKSPPQAEVYPVSREVLWNLNIDEEQKQRLWSMYKEDEHTIPAVQRLNATTFAVKCSPSKNFTAGRLHVTAISNAVSTKKGTYACCCKKLKIVVEPDNSVLLENDVCDHLLLVLAAIFSKPNGKNMYANFINALKSSWMPLALETPLVDNTRDDTLFGMDGHFIETVNEANTDGVFIFSDDFPDSNIPDFSDVILNLIPNEKEHPKPDNAFANSPYNPSVDVIHTGDPNLVSSCALIEDDDMRLKEVPSSTPYSMFSPFKLHPNGQVSNMEETHLELSDCNIELMDQFQLTDQIDLCSNDIALSTNPSNPYEDNTITIFPPPTLAIQEADQTVTFKTFTTAPTQPSPTLRQNVGSASLLKSNQTPVLDLATPLPIEMPTIAVVKKHAIKASEIVTEVKTRKFPHIPAKRDVIVNAPPKSDANSQSKSGGNTKNEPNCLPMAKEPVLSFSAWLDNVIEVLNESVVIDQETDIRHTFPVHEEIFSHWSKTFSMGTKLRMYNSLTVMKKGKYKGLMKYTWNFTTASTVRRIFSTQNISLETERMFVRNDSGNFVPFVRETPAVCIEKGQRKRPIYAKLELYTAFIWFECSNKDHKTGLKVIWMPNAFPKSHFGILDIQFSKGIRDPTGV